MSGQDRLRFTILGCGSSPGTPRVTGDWGECDPLNPKNRRTRTAALIERIKPCGKKTSVVIDTGPDFREQMLREGVKNIDAVFFTHAHADHTHGIDDLRSYALKNKKCVDVYADSTTLEYLKKTFGYCFETPAGSSYPAILNEHVIGYHHPVVVEGEGGTIHVHPLLQTHGTINSLGFRVGSLAYCPDVNNFPEETIKKLQGLKWLILDALQYKKHMSHFSVSQALEWVECLRPQYVRFIHMHISLDYEYLQKETPKHIEPAYDGMVLEEDNFFNDTHYLE